MINNKRILIFMFFIFGGLMAFSMGKKETYEFTTENLNSWSEVVDVTDAKPGKYNILITAEDLAQNQGLAGPFNLFIDPESDLPVTQITNPLHNSRVPGNLNIVGTCIDDDAVEYVELIIDGAEPIRAEGKEFWSYYLETNDMSEGVHTISAYGVDIYGVPGRTHTVAWHLDRNQPETEVFEPAQMGSLVSGKFKLSGIVTDGNGIKNLAYSLDKGDSFYPLRLAHDKKTNVWRFSFTVDSKKLPDGPAVCWFKAEDKQGSIGYYTYLFYVDNTKPVIEFVSPEDGTMVNGAFVVTGLATDDVGLESLSWKWGKETGEFELTKGNPYWVKELDVTGQKIKATELTIIAQDTVGNITKATKKIAVNNADDIPLLEVESPVSGDIFEKTVKLSGFAKDNREIKEIRYSINKSEAYSIETSGSFYIDLEDFAVGKHTIEVWAVDTSNIASEKQKIDFTISGNSPVIEFSPIELAYKEIHPESGHQLKAYIASDAGLKSVQWQIDGLQEISAKIKQGIKELDLSIPLPPTIPYGLVKVEVRAVDLFDREIRETQYFYSTNISIPHNSPQEFSNTGLSSSGEVEIPGKNKEPSTFGTASIQVKTVFPEERMFENGMTIELAGPAASKEELVNKAILLEIASPIPIVSVLWSINESDPVKASVAKTEIEETYTSSIPLKALLPAGWTSFEAHVAFKDGSEQTVHGTFCVVRPMPQAGVNDSEQFVWTQARKDNAGRIMLFDSSRAQGFYNGKLDRVATAVELASETDGITSGIAVSIENNTITVRPQKSGTYTDLVFIITDSEGETFTTEPVSFVVDSEIPSIQIDVSERQVWLQKELPIQITATDDSGIEKIEYSFNNGASWVQFSEDLEGAPTNTELDDAVSSTNTESETERTISTRMDISHLPDGKVALQVRATDVYGRTTIEERVFIKDTLAPEIYVLVPEAGAVINGETRIAFDVRDASPIVRAEYRAPANFGSNQENDDSQENADDSNPENDDNPNPWIPFTYEHTPTTTIGTKEKPIDPAMEFRFTDSAGNQGIINYYPFKIDSEADKPIVELHVPADNEVITKDFVFSGVVYDDDEPARIWYKIDSDEFTPVDIENSFSIPIELLSLTDNEHIVTMYAEDIHGVIGDQITRVFRVSLEEPKAEVLTPSFDETVSALIEITGTASDKNGIARVEISVDNGNSFNLAEGTESWSYRFDSRVLQDGTHVVFVRVYDTYDISGLYSSLINIDNTAPSIKLELPLDGSRASSVLFVSGQSMDNIFLEKVSASINNISAKQPAVPESLQEIPFENELIISSGIDISELPEGFYNLEVRGFDRAGNVTRVARNFEIYRSVDRNRIEFLYPLNGEHVQGMFNLYGKVVSEDPVSHLILYVNDADVAFTELSSSGYFKFTLGPEDLSDGIHKIAIRALVDGDKIIESETRYLEYSAAGPWITIDNFTMGDFAIERPWLAGATGYALSEDDIIALKAKETTPEARRRLQEKTLEKVEISFDNGKTFHKTESGRKWRYRIEPGDMPEGYHFLLVRAKMKNGEIAVTRSIVQIDKTNPVIQLISPGEGGRYNNELVFSGLSSDDVELAGISLALRKGDKSAYAVPSFIQGLYFDWHVWGASLYDLGLGLTFFDDNVKLQAQFGQFTQAQRDMFNAGTLRYGGNIIGIKLLANLLYLPLEFYLGPDFSWLSASAAVGANFSLFSDTQSGKAQLLSAMLAQLEFPRVTIPKRKTFRTFSFYTELQLWFIPTDVDSAEVDIDSMVPHITGGIRLNVF